MKKTAIAAISLLLLAGCAATESEAELTGYALVSKGLEASCEAFETGSAVNQVEVDGDYGTEPEVSFPTPLLGEGVETKVVIEGDGGKIVGSQRVALHFTGLIPAQGSSFRAQSSVRTTSSFKIW